MTMLETEGLKKVREGDCVMSRDAWLAAEKGRSDE
jgi:hypothetical protein